MILKSLIGKELLFLVKKGHGGARECVWHLCIHNGYVVDQICHDKQVLRMFHTQEYGTIQHEVKAQKMGEKSFLENSYMILKQPASELHWLNGLESKRKIFWLTVVQQIYHNQAIIGVMIVNKVHLMKMFRLLNLILPFVLNIMNILPIRCTLFGPYVGM